ncbi:MAG TPA: twin-arginine translocase TatA/TatE family subunit [Pirellulales bacterium]|nr:twin-arginine translocase TatA/TatE family subunit [Pirellulales bacterium]
MSPLFGMFGVGPMELVIVGGVILLLFGNRLPSLMRSLGRSVVEFKHGAREIDEEEQEKLSGKSERMEEVKKQEGVKQK